MLTTFEEPLTVFAEGQAVTTLASVKTEEGSITAVVTAPKELRNLQQDVAPYSRVLGVEGLVQAP